MANKFVNISSLLKHAIETIERFDAELLLAYTLKKNREFVVTYPESAVSFFQKHRFLSLVKKRASGIPLAYLTGHKKFFGLDFLVNKHTLVPRPDTEILVEEVLKKIKNIPAFTLIDIGTGSGCIPISLAKNTNQNNIQIFATDISSEALKVAQKNATKHHVKINFLQGNLLEPFFNITPTTSDIVLTANLPYLTEEQFQKEKSIQHEPHSALVATENGLALYKQLLEQIQNFITNKKLSCTCFFEIDPSQSAPLSTEITKNFPESTIKIHKDLCGRDRILQFQI